MAVFITSQLSSTILPTSVTSRSVSTSTTSSVERATQTSSQQIQASSSRDNTTKSLSNLTTEQIVASLSIPSSDIRSSTATSTSIVSMPISSVDLKSSIEANEILRNITVATVSTGQTSSDTTQTNIPTSSGGTNIGTNITTSVASIGADRIDSGKSGVTPSSTISLKNDNEIFISIPTTITTIQPVDIESKDVVSDNNSVQTNDNELDQSIKAVITDIEQPTLQQVSDIKTVILDNITIEKLDLKKDTNNITVEKLNLKKDSKEKTIKKVVFKQTDKFAVKTKIYNKNLTPIIYPTKLINLNIDTISIPTIKVVTSSLMNQQNTTSVRSVYDEWSAPSSDPVLFSGSFSMGSDSFNLDTPGRDLRSYSMELLSSFDQIGSMFPECEILAMINDDGKVIIVFRMSDFNNFVIKIFDVFYDRKVFYNGYSTIDTANSFLDSPFVDVIPATFPPNDILSFTREQARDAVIRNKEIIKKYGINVDLNYSIFGTDDDRVIAKKLLEFGAFDYSYNSDIQNDTIFVHKIYGTDLTSASAADVTSMDVESSAATSISSATPTFTTSTSGTSSTPVFTPVGS